MRVVSSFWFILNLTGVLAVAAIFIPLTFSKQDWCWNLPWSAMDSHSCKPDITPLRRSCISITESSIFAERPPKTRGGNNPDNFFLYIKLAIHFTGWRFAINQGKNNLDWALKTRLDSDGKPEEGRPKKRKSALKNAKRCALVLACLCSSESCWWQLTKSFVVVSSESGGLIKAAV